MERGTSIDEQMKDVFPRSAELFRRAARSLPGGLTHDSRVLFPHPVYIERTDGVYKWAVDGPQLIDYWMGHGAMILGHNSPVVADAIAGQLRQGTLYGAPHLLEIEWAEQIKRLMPALDLVRFVSSGTEATQLAMRLARAYTGRTKILRFTGHFHGWHDEAAKGTTTAVSGTAVQGVPASTIENTVAVPPSDLEAVGRALAETPIAGIILEPSGGAWGAIPTSKAFLEGLRALADQHGAVLIFDEVITGFRLSPGGAQEYFGVRPDLVCLAKIIAGGLPGGAVAGREQIMEHLAFKADDTAWNRYRKISHQGTFNANPLSAAAGLAVLREVEKKVPLEKADQACAQLVEGLNDVLAQSGVPGVAYRLSSMFHIALGVDAGVMQGTEPADLIRRAEILGRVSKQPWVYNLRKAMLLEGVDWMRAGGFLSKAHTQDDIDDTLTAFGNALTRLDAEELLPGESS